MKKTLLIVDDDSAVRLLLRKVLQAEGYNVVEAPDGREALDMVKKSKPGLVLLDIHMAHLDGILALDAIQELDPKIAVIMITGDQDINHARLAMDRGARECLRKPFDLEAVKASVKKFC